MVDRIKSNYPNTAFISYKSEDKRWAKWLQRKLERYRIPRQIRDKYPELPEKINHIFRDETDLSGGVLRASLIKELLDSQYLVVVCSPRATKSKWVNEEIETFVNADRSSNIIPFIIEGTPHSGDEKTECFPKALAELPKEDELLGLDVQKVGRQKALARVVATILDVRFDDLWQRHHRRLARRRIVFAAMLATCLLSSCALWYYLHPVYRYFADYVDCNGVPEGVIPLTDEQVAHREYSYRFQYNRIPLGEPGALEWRLKRVSSINSSGNVEKISLLLFSNRYPVIELEYNKNTGSISKVINCDKKNRPIVTYMMSEHDGQAAMIADFVASNKDYGFEYADALFIDPSKGDDDDTRKSGIVRYAYQRDKNGHIVKLSFHSSNDYDLARSTIVNQEGVASIKYTLDSLGRRIKEEYFDLQGNKTSAKEGIYSTEYEYDSLGTPVTTCYYDSTGNLTGNDRYWAICRSKTDRYGNCIECCYYNEKDQPCVTKLGASHEVFSFDENGHWVSYENYDTNGRLVFVDDGWARSKMEYDRRGNRISFTYYGTDNQKCICKDGYSTVRYKFNRHNDLKTISFFDNNGKPAYNIQGIAKALCKYDRQGRRTEEAYYGIDGRPCYSKKGMSKDVFVYDNNGRIVKEQYYGIDGKPTLIDNGSAELRRKYDDRGNVAEESFYGINGKPIKCKDGYAVVRFRYDDKGNRTEFSYYDTYGARCADSVGVSAYVNKFDNRGNRVEVAYYNTYGERCVYIDEYSRFISKYDVKGNLIEQRYFDTADKPCFTIDRYAVMKKSYDNRCRVTEEHCFDTCGNPCMNVSGYSSAYFSYIGDNIKISRLYDAKGSPCTGKTGLHKIIQTFDHRGNVVEESYYDVNEHLCDDNGGVARTVQKYDQYGRKVEESYYGKDGNPVKANSYQTSKIRYKYDSRGNIVELSFYDTLGHLGHIAAPIVRKEYDEKGYMMKESYFGVDGKPCALNNGVSYCIAERDAKGKLTALSFYDINGWFIDRKEY
ncbi:MAG: TIR domain-containing protein [Bacteroidales bacterium]|nr:TIR domain-containing protein [Bacteroidales bacterium]